MDSPPATDDPRCCISACSSGMGCDPTTGFVGSAVHAMVCGGGAPTECAGFGICPAGAGAGAAGLAAVTGGMLGTPWGFMLRIANFVKASFAPRS